MLPSLVWNEGGEALRSRVSTAGDGESIRSQPPDMPRNGRALALGTKTEIRLTNIKVKDPLVDDASLFDSMASYHAPLWQIFADRWLGGGWPRRGQH
jgi:hypothetical protein